MNFASDQGRWRVATILDDFSAHAFAPDCIAQPLTPWAWQTELDAFKPDFLLVESAWRGWKGAWAGHVHKGSELLQHLVRGCADRGIPTVFWNKEDPVHFDGFLPAAHLFDHVFTTDFDSIPAYRKALGHDRVYLLPFGIQPLHFNPVEEFERSDNFFFAGSYYHKYPQRRKDFASIAKFALSVGSLDIYDRNIARSGRNFLYPERYLPYVIGDLPFDAMPQLAKAYNAGLNLNTVKQSQTMVARRVFELLASNTIVVSNYARAVRQLFGDLVISSDNTDEIHTGWRELTADRHRMGKVRLAALRNVMSRHTCSDRLERIARKARPDLGTPSKDPVVLVVAQVSSTQAAARLIAAYSTQSYQGSRLLLVCDEAEMQEDIAKLQGSLHVIDTTALPTALDEADYVSFWSHQDHYGKNFLTDLVLSTRYWSGSGVGKRARFVRSGSDVQLIEEDVQYVPVRRLDWRCALVARDVAKAMLGSTERFTDGWAVASDGFLAIDPYNYCRDLAETATELQALVDDIPDLWEGLDLQAFETARSAPLAAPDLLELDAADIATRMPKAHHAALVVRAGRKSVRITSKLEPGNHARVRLIAPFPLPESAKDTGIRVLTRVGPPQLHPNLRLIHEFLDSEDNVIDHQTQEVDQPTTLAPPVNAVAVRFSLRIEGPGEVRWEALTLGGAPERDDFLPVPMSRVIVIARQYPSYGDHYRYAFIHARVRAYREAGVKVDVFRLQEEPVTERFTEFEGADIVTGNRETLTAYLQSGLYRHVLVHFLDSALWTIVAPHLDQLRLTVWVHGAEIQPPARRGLGDTTSIDGLPDARVRRSHVRMAFWRRLLEGSHPHVDFVFVSQTLLAQSLEDLGMTATSAQISVINNPIDTDYFLFANKPDSARSAILLLRPFTSRIQANDVAVAAILELSRRPGFDKLHFTIAGDGPLFDETVEPLRGFDNVRLLRGFFSREKIKALHLEHGLFLCPSRMDSQGVSRDEAMSSGLVPITSAVGAIPEFVDSSCGYLAPAEDSSGLADAIMELQTDPERFQRLSQAAAARVRTRSASKTVAVDEIALLSGIEQDKRA